MLIVGLLITAALAYRAVDNEVSLGRAYRQSVAHNNAAGQALEALLDLRGSLHAYVAPGQGVPFWSRRSEQLLDTLRESLATLDAAMATSGGSLAETLAAVDQLAAAERRTREYARRGETLLAGDVVFTEARDLLTASVEQIQSARTTLAAANDSARRVAAPRTGHPGQRRRRVVDRDRGLAAASRQSGTGEGSRAPGVTRSPKPSRSRYPRNRSEPDP